MASHLPVVGERGVDGKLSLCGLQMQGNAAFTWGEERKHGHENHGMRQTWNMSSDVAVALGANSLKQLTRQGLTDKPL